MCNSPQESGIDKIIPGMVIDDYLFDPCGYSMNGVAKDVSTTLQCFMSSLHHTKLIEWFMFVVMRPERERHTVSKLQPSIPY